MGLLIFFFLTSICFSFLCSIWEAVILSVTPSYVNREVQEGTATGKLLQAYKQDIDKPLSAVLTLNTIAHTVGAIGVGAQGEPFLAVGKEALVEHRQPFVGPDHWPNRHRQRVPTPIARLPRSHS